MIHVIGSHNEVLYTDKMYELFRLRHQIFVEERGWKKLLQPNGLDIDEFDTENTTYFIKLAPDGRILGGIRLYPTTGPTQLNTIFKDTCLLAEQPVGPEHYEWSRYFIADKSYRGANRRPVIYELYAAVLEYALSKNIRSLSGYTDTNTFVRFGKFWDVEQLGLPTNYGGTDGEPLGNGLPHRLNLNHDMLGDTKVLWKIEKPILSLSLGCRNLAHEKGYNANTVIAFEKFLQEHPDHTETLLMLDDAFNGPGQVPKSSSQLLLNKILMDDFVGDFENDLLARTTNFPNVLTSH